LFNDKFVISDSQYLNSLNFRTLVQGDEAFRSILTKETFGIAIRNLRGFSTLREVQSLFEDETHTHRTLDGAPRSKKIKIPENLFREKSDLHFIEKHSDLISWNYEAVESEYDRLCQDLLLRDDLQEKYGPNYRTFAEETFSNARARHPFGRLSRLFIENEFLPIIKRTFNITDDALASDFDARQKISYFTTLPSVLSAQPVYGQEHEEMFNLLENRSHNVELLAPPKRFKAVHRGSSYVEGLRALRGDDVNFLLATDECRSLRNQFQLFDGTDAHALDVEIALVDYIQRIDDTISQRLNLSSSKTREAEFEIRRQAAVYKR